MGRFHGCAGVRTFGGLLGPVLLLAAWPSAAAANDFNYTYLEAGVVRLDDRDLDVTGTGFGIDGSLAVLQNLYLFGGYTDAKIDVDGIPFKVTESLAVAGLGLHTPVSDRVDAVAEAAYLHARASGGGFSLSDSGYGLAGGVRAWATEALEVNGAVEYTRFNDDDGGDTSYDVGAVLSVTDPLAVALDVSKSGQFWTYAVSLRGYF